MTIRAYHFPGEVEVNFIGKIWNLRLGNKQTELWWNYKSVLRLRNRR